MAKGRWLDKPWVVANCDTAQTHEFATRVEAEQWVKRQMVSGQLTLYPDSAFRILSAAEVRDVEAVGATIFDDFGEPTDYAEMENSKIEWTHHTFNPWIGCQEVSPGCGGGFGPENGVWCYARAMMDHRYHRVEWGPHGERIRTSKAYWRKPRRWAKEAAAAGEHHRVFCASLADWLDNKAPQEWRVDLAAVIAATPELNWLLLTKRIENYRKLAPWKEPPPNVWLGVTAENQDYYDSRWKILRTIPAHQRFISYEPAMGPLTRLGGTPPLPDWIICGGQSGGREAIIMPPQWARDCRDLCAAAGVAFFMKQMTNKAPIPDDLMIRQFPLIYG